jgi:hypothetical protein
MPTEILTPTTELEAVNACLASIGEAPVTQVEASFVDAELAQNLLRSVSRAEQTKGFTFNTEKAMILSPDVNGIIWLPENTLSFLQIEDRTVVQRGKRLYSTTTHSYVFTAAVTADLVVALQFDELPEALRHYVYVAAARRFQNRMGADRVVHQISVDDELRAKADWMNVEAEVGNYNALTNNALLTTLKNGRP